MSFFDPGSYTSQPTNDPSSFFRSNPTAGGGSGEGASGPTDYRVKLSYAGIPGENAFLLGELFNTSVRFQNPMDNSRMRCLVPPVDDYFIYIKKNGANIGEIKFASGSTDASFSLFSTTTFISGDAMTLVAQEDLDVIRGIFGTISGYYV